MLSKISKVVTVFQIGFSVVKEVHELVQLVEEDDVDDGEKYGDKKKEAVLNVIGAVYDAGTSVVEIPIERESVMDLADKAIEVFVGFYNAIGRFRSHSK